MNKRVKNSLLVLLTALLLMAAVPSMWYNVRTGLKMKHGSDSVMIYPNGDSVNIRSSNTTFYFNGQSFVFKSDSNTLFWLPWKILKAISDSIAAHPGGGGTPGGADTYVQYDSAGAFSGNNGLTYNRTTKKLGIFGMLFTNDAATSMYFSGRAVGTTYGSNLGIYAQQAKSGATDANGGSVNIYAGGPTGAGVSKITFSTYGGGGAGTTDRNVSEKACIYGAGYFGIGLTAPTDFLHIKSGSSTVGQIHLNKSSVACGDSGTFQRTAYEFHFADDDANVQDFVQAGYGEMYMANSASVSYSTVAAYTTVTGLTAGSCLKYIAIVNDSALIVSTGGAGKYKVSWKIDWTQTGSTPYGIEGIIYVNSTVQAATYGRNVRAGEDVSTVYGQGIISLNTNDKITLKYKNLGTGIAFVSVSVIIERFDR
jgi:hypothetical protein